ncbi:peptide/nickel transport system permease protein [Thermomonospora echinospora]|uniref:Peptide/nickel transport system permease protein n=2 Tax=Thermomonospora echinospora TaxID=1992 RepID=A0A1H6E8C4_9ACTN|nr:peptide/nickel transport system permease protein [Thermomonospora echinospora]
MTATEIRPAGKASLPAGRGRTRRGGMTRYVLARVARLLSIIAGVTFISFFLLKLTPGDPVATALGPEATPEQVERLRASLGLDRPAWEQYLDWLGGVLHGDFGTTLTQPSRPVGGELAARLPVTLQLIALTIVLSLAISIPLAVWSAHRAGRTFDRAVSSVLYGLVALPGFVAALLLVLVFVFHADAARTAGLAVAGAALAMTVVAALRSRRARSSPLPPLIGGGAVAAVGLAVYALLPDFPRQGFVPLGEGVGANLTSVALPVIALTFVDIAVFTRLLRGDMITELAKPHVLASRAKGMSTAHVLLRESLRPSMFSLITVVGLTIGQLIGGTIIVEHIFRLPGVGSLLVASVRNGDHPVVQAAIFVIATVYVTVNSLIDIAYAYLDPRVRQVNS